MPRAAAFFLLLASLVACHERRITRTVYPHETRLVPPDSTRYGKLTLHLVREVRRPWGIGRFPDGGTAIEKAAYYEVRQHASGHPTRILGRLPLRPVRRGSYGDILHGGWSWPAPNRLRWWVRHGYLTSPQVRTDTAEIEIPALGGSPEPARAFR